MTHPVAALFKRITQGVYVVGVAHEEARNAFTAACVMQVSFNPLVLAVAINPQHASYEVLNKGGVFSVNVIKSGEFELAARFGQRGSAHKLVSSDWTSGRTGAPLLHRALAWFECEMTDQHPAGDHVVVFGKVICGQLLDPNAEPMIYRDTGDMDGAAALFPETLAASFQTPE